MWQKAIFWRILSCWGRVGCGSRMASLVLFRLSTDWVKPTYIMEDILLYSKSTDLNVNLRQNSLTKTPKIMFHQLPGYLVSQPS